LTAENIEYFDCDLIEEQLTIISNDFIRNDTLNDTELKTSKSSFLVSYLKNFEAKIPEKISENNFRCRLSIVQNIELKTTIEPKTKTS
jgi:hypothetical protein